MIRKPLVSILISAYNAEKFLIPTLQSVLGQTYKDIEILVLDDASKDHTYDLRKIIDDERVKRFRSDINIGPYGGLNYLLERATGSYIAIQDHDDFRHPEKIEKQVMFLEKNQEYVGCGTKTLMRYESDHKGFEYFLGIENYYTIHPSLVFRNDKKYRYSLGNTYMNDALFQKMVLCNGGKKMIYNIDELLTLHLIKNGAKNLSYKRFQYSWMNVKTIFTIHSIFYGLCILLWESMRRLIYPVLKRYGQGKWIDFIERIPFILQGYKIQKYNQQDIKNIFDI